MTSLQELIDVCEGLHRGAPTPLWFRGHSDHTWTLRPKAYRSFPIDEYSGSIQEDALFIEREMAWRFMSGAPSRYDRCPASGEFTRWLTLMQHYGLPTRLLDWTVSVSVATYFGVDPEYDKVDGAIWALRSGILNTYMLKLFEAQMPYGYNGVLFFDDAIQPVRDLAKPVFEGEELGFGAVFAVVPQEHDRRVAAQQSMFTLHGSTCPLSEPHWPLWGNLPDDLLAEIVIPAKAKERIRKSLSLLGVTRPSLFPDLDNLARDIRETDEEKVRSSNRWPRELPTGGDDS